MQKTMVERLPVQVQRGYLVGELVITPENKERYAKAWAQLEALVKVLWQAKVPVVAGTDSPEAGLALHLELELLVQAGIPVADVLRIATVDAAKAMRQDFGTIAPGKRADLVVIDGDPLADITQLRKVVSTMRSGVIYAAKPLLDAQSVTQ
jgi:imidazolonepropionase-like amidohydrolase